MTSSKVGSLVFGVQQGTVGMYMSDLPQVAVDACLSGSGLKQAVVGSRRQQLCHRYYEAGHDIGPSKVVHYFRYSSYCRCCFVNLVDKMLVLFRLPSPSNKEARLRVLTA